MTRFITQRFYNDDMKKKLLLISFLLLTLPITLVAQEPVRFTASAPSSVALERPFQLVYTVNATGKDLRTAEFNHFEILAGPFESRSSSYQIVNGKANSSVTVTYTYTLQATKVGTFTIPSASITVDGKKHNSNGVSIKVLPADEEPAERSSKNNQNPKASGTAISDEHVFIKTHVSKSSVYEQEPVLITYKLYTLLDVVQCTNRKMPDFKGFMKNEIELTQNKQFSYENLNGRNYGSVVLFQALLYPQQAGELRIEKAVFDAVIRIQNKQQVRSIFDDFFDSYSNVQKTLVAPSARVHVKALPGNKPANFNGAVGALSVNSSLSAQRVKANEAVTLKITLSGSGNLRMIQNPIVAFPDGIEVYDPKVTNNFKTSTTGVSGAKIIEYMFIPRHAGNYEIPSVEITYFDINLRSFKTLRTPKYTLQVDKGVNSGEQAVSANFATKEDVKQLATDIHYIYTGHIHPNKNYQPFFGTPLSWLLYIVPLMLTIGLFIVFRKKAIERADIGLVRNKNANKLAQKRLKIAARMLNEGNTELFYEEIMKAVWNYLSYKLNITVSMLTKDNVIAELQNRNIDEVLIQEIIHILNTCEFARFAPTNSQQEMGHLYASSISALSKLENSFRKV